MTRQQPGQDLLRCCSTDPLAPICLPCFILTAITDSSCAWGRCREGVLLRLPCSQLRVVTRAAPQACQKSTSRPFGAASQLRPLQKVLAAFSSSDTVVEAWDGGTMFRTAYLGAEQGHPGTAPRTTRQRMQGLPQRLLLRWCTSPLQASPNQAASPGQTPWRRCTPGMARISTSRLWLSRLGFNQGAGPTAVHMPRCGGRVLAAALKARGPSVPGLGAMGKAYSRPSQG